MGGRRGRRGRRGRGLRGHGGGGRTVASADCGSAARAAAAQQQQQQQLPQLSESQVMAEILGSTPARVFLQPGDSCTVCLEEYDSAVWEAGGGAQGAAASVNAALQALRPQLCALRCGHVVHIECLERAVASEASHRVRCPLCREPATLAGAVRQGLFA